MGKVSTAKPRYTERAAREHGRQEPCLFSGDSLIITVVSSLGAEERGWKI
jgi:hypothetical protein